MDPVTISLIVGIGVLLIERIYSWSLTITKSQCCCCNFIRKESTDKNDNKTDENNIKEQKNINKIPNPETEK